MDAEQLLKQRQEQMARAREKAPKKPKGHRANISTLNISDLPGVRKSPLLDSRQNIKEKHAKTDEAIRRVEQSVKRVFDFFDGVMDCGNEVITRIKERRKNKNVTVDDVDMEILKEARTVGTLFMNKTVPDILANDEGAKARAPVNIVFGAQLAPLLGPPPEAVDITPNPEEDDDGTDTTASDLQPESLSSEDSP